MFEIEPGPVFKKKNPILMMQQDCSIIYKTILLHRVLHSLLTRLSFLLLSHISVQLPPYLPLNVCFVFSLPATEVNGSDKALNTGGCRTWGAVGTDTKQWHSCLWGRMQGFAATSSCLQNHSQCGELVWRFCSLSFEWL